MSNEIEKATRDAVQAAAQSERYAELRAAGRAEQQPQIVHVHQAPPDRTVQRLALGAGMGGGAVTAAVFLGPMLIAAITAITAQLAVLAVLVAVVAWAVVTVVKAVSGTGRRKD